VELPGVRIWDDKRFFFIYGNLDKYSDLEYNFIHLIIFNHFKGSCNVITEYYREFVQSMILADAEYKNIII